MEKKYFLDAYFYQCPKCKQQSLETAYYAAFDKSEIGAARQQGRFTYHCSKCGAAHSSASVKVNGETNEVSKEEAVSHGVAWESKGSS